MRAQQLILALLISTAWQAAGAEPAHGRQAEYKITIPEALDRAECLLRQERCGEALPLLQEIEQRYGTAQLARVTYDGCSALFVVWAGLARAYEALRYQHNNDPALVSEARRYAALAQHAPQMNARRYGLLLAHASALPEEWPGEFDELRQTALAAYPATVWQMNHVRRAVARRYEWRGRLDLAARVHEDMQGQDAFVYAHAGLIHAWLGRYDEAFATWYTGLLLAPLEQFGAFGNMRIREHLREWAPYANLEELTRYADIMRRVAARYPALPDNTSSIVRWARQASDVRIAFELQVRRLEMERDALVSNLWQQGLTEYGHPVYAVKLGQYDTAGRLYSTRLQAEKKLARAVVLINQIEPLVPYFSAETSNAYQQALAVRWRRTGRYRRAAKRDGDVARLVEQLARARKVIGDWQARDSHGSAVTK